MVRKLNETEVYYAGLVVRAAGGCHEATRCLTDAPNIPAEIVEWYGLYMDLNIRFNSPAHRRLNELTEKYETQ